MPEIAAREVRKPTGKGIKAKRSGGWSGKRRGSSDIEENTAAKKT
jgi:hypothetical protein